LEANDLDVEVLQASFSLDHLSIPHDFAKFDIEGSEAVLMDYSGYLGSCAIETHDKIHRAH
jgi:hypothetical protein